ncbi:MAG: hypothetical protein E7453_06170 [Ruminococcaceae bacterium]|nr:hypothetical protein [Oscillospiraceae bacterium]
MIQANINKKNKQQIIHASGSIVEMMNDVAILISGIYTQLGNHDPASAAIFRTGLQNMTADSRGPMWQNYGDRTGIIITLPPDE